MRLSDNDIIKYLAEGKLKITPEPSQNAISGVTVDVRLGNKFRVFKSYGVPYIDLSATKDVLNAQIDKIMSAEIHIEDDDLFFLHPGELALAHTYEDIEIPDNLVGWLDGRSSLARLGLMVHITAHRIDPGWSGNIVLEFYNSGHLPLAMKPKMTIGALSFELTSSPVSKPYVSRQDAKYRYQHNVVSSKISEDL